MFIVFFYIVSICAIVLRSGHVEFALNHAYCNVALVFTIKIKNKKN